MPDVPCVYKMHVNVHIIVMVYDRAESLQKVLNSVQNLDLGGDSAALEIWIDRS